MGESRVPQGSTGSSELVGDSQEWRNRSRRRGATCRRAAAEGGSRGGRREGRGRLVQRKKIGLSDKQSSATTAGQYELHVCSRILEVAWPVWLFLLAACLWGEAGGAASESINLCRDERVRGASDVLLSAAMHSLHESCDWVTARGCDVVVPIISVQPPSAMVDGHVRGMMRSFLPLTSQHIIENYRLRRGHGKAMSEEDEWWHQHRSRNSLKLYQSRW